MNCAQKTMQNASLSNCTFILFYIVLFTFNVLRANRLSSVLRPNSQQQTLRWFFSSFRRQQFYLTVNTASEMQFNAFQCIAQPNTALHGCILYLPQFLWSRHFAGLCKSVHPWRRVSEIQSIKETEFCSYNFSQTKYTFYKKNIPWEPHACS